MIGLADAGGTSRCPTGITVSYGRTIRYGEGMTLMSLLRDRAAQETAEREMTLAREADAEEERCTRRCLLAVSDVMVSRWGMAPPMANSTGAVTAFDRLNLPVEVTVERGDPYPHGAWRPLERVLVEVDEVTFVCTEDRADGWDFPRVQLGRYCRYCGSTVAVGGNVGASPQAVQLLEGPMPEHTVMEGDRAHRCDGEQMRPVPEPPERRRDRVVLIGPGEEPMEALAADEWVIEKWLGAVSVAGNPVAVAVVTDGRHLDDEEPF